MLTGDAATTEVSCNLLKKLGYSRCDFSCTSARSLLASKRRAILMYDYAVTQKDDVKRESNESSALSPLSQEVLKAARRRHHPHRRTNSQLP
jgi:hypothetical protein